MSHLDIDSGFAEVVEFLGLVFKGGLLKTEDLQPLNLNYTLVMIDGCCSAQIDDAATKRAAQDWDTLSASAEEFADAFGLNSAYLGWGWTMTPKGAQDWTSEFIGYLKGGRTVSEAHEKFRSVHDEKNEGNAHLLLKLYKNGNTGINPNAKQAH